jgi:hypothetical protein
MKKNYWWFMVVIVFVAGLMISNMLVVQAKENTPVVQAEENTPVVKWEYKIVNTKNQGTKPRQRAQDLPVLNSNGADGWELCGVHGTMYFFKREIRE